MPTYQHSCLIPPGVTGAMLLHPQHEASSLLQLIRAVHQVAAVWLLPPLACSWIVSAPPLQDDTVVQHKKYIGLDAEYSNLQDTFRS